MADDFPRLVADVGGTNARFALQRDAAAGITDTAVLASDDHPSLEDAIRAYLRRQGGATPRRAVIGIATPVVGDEVRMTNHPWAFSIAALKASLQLERLAVINDFTALALALPALTDADRVPVGPGSARAGATMALIGPGTGLGVGGLACRGSLEVPLAGEGGHVTLAPVDAREAAVVEQLQRRFGHASAERALSGAGLVNLHDACRALDGEPALALEAADVTRRALDGDDRHCSEAVELFFALLGTTAGNLALTVGAAGGVYIGGGIVPRLLPLIGGSKFRLRFEAKGRFADYLRAIPTFVIDSAVPAALIGAVRAFDRLD